MKEVPVLIAGGGPVGLTLAKTLASFGIECMLVERNPSTTRHPKMDITNSRSMELFRKLRRIVDHVSFRTRTASVSLSERRAGEGAHS
jgi:2-polyprenyl-6-methoxyphenol hydroxylase-like FAD-dependent oxidoreductase